VPGKTRAAGAGAKRRSAVLAPESTAGWASQPSAQTVCHASVASELCHDDALKRPAMVSSAPNITRASWSPRSERSTPPQ